MEHMGSAHTQRAPNFRGRDSAAVGHDAPPVLGLMKMSICTACHAHGQGKDVRRAAIARARCQELLNNPPQPCGCLLRGCHWRGEGGKTGVDAGCHYVGMQEAQELHLHKGLASVIHEDDACRGPASGSWRGNVHRCTVSRRGPRRMVWAVGLWAE